MSTSLPLPETRAVHRMRGPRRALCVAITPTHSTPPFMKALHLMTAHAMARRLHPPALILSIHWLTGRWTVMRHARWLGSSVELNGNQLRPVSDYVACGFFWSRLTSQTLAANLNMQSDEHGLNCKSPRFFNHNVSSASQGRPKERLRQQPILRSGTVCWHTYSLVSADCLCAQTT